MVSGLVVCFVIVVSIIQDAKKEVHEKIRRPIKQEVEKKARKIGRPIAPLPLKPEVQPSPTEPSPPAKKPPSVPPPSPPSHKPVSTTVLPQKIGPPEEERPPRPFPRKKPVFSKARIYVDTEPETATVRILNIKPKYRRGMGLKEGPHHLQVSQKGYETKRRWVQITAARDNTFSFKLNRLVVTGTLTVRSDPSGAEWFLDGKLQGITPDKKEGTKQGHYLIVVKKDGYDDWSETVSMKPKEEKVVQAELSVVGPRPGELWSEPVTGMTFVWVPDGCFKMGSPSDETGRDSDEGPVNEVCVDGFWMGRTEVTNAQYRRFKPDHDSKAYHGQSLSGDNQPVVHVSWMDAGTFAQWVTQRNGGPYQFRLPTEAEWEYACRAGSTSARFWGENPDDACLYANVHDRNSKRVNSFVWLTHDCDDGYAVTSPAGSFRPNAFGLHDMLGNVWEWCQDTYGENSYRKHRAHNPKDTTDGPFRVNRGGSWSDVPRSVRCAVRERLDSQFGNFYLGFRLVRTPREDRLAPIKEDSLNPDFN